MSFINKNITMILSFVLSYVIIYFTAEDLPKVIELFSGMRVEVNFFMKYKFPVIILAFLLFPFIEWLKKKVDLYRGDSTL
jgi:hypothetical protein